MVLNEHRMIRKSVMLIPHILLMKGVARAMTESPKVNPKTQARRRREATMIPVPTRLRRSHPLKMNADRSTCVPKSFLRLVLQL